MATMLDEHTAFSGPDGKPYVDGYIYIGTVNLDPKLNTILIYSDRGLMTNISNPQRIDANGRAVNKIWIPERYSLKVEDVNNVQVYEELDNGEAIDPGIINLTDVSGSDTITAVSNPVTTEYVNNQLYVFNAVSANAGPVTVDYGAGAVAVIKNQDKLLDSGDFSADQTIITVYNSADTNMEWVNKASKNLDFYEGADIESDTTTNIWSTDGDTVHLTVTTEPITTDDDTVPVTATTEPITSLGTAPHIGARKRVIADGEFTLQNGENLILQGGIDHVALIGDVFDVYAETVTQHRVTTVRQDGLPSIGGSILGESQDTTSGTAWTFTTPRLDPIKAEVLFDGFQLSGSGETVIQVHDSNGKKSTGYDSQALTLKASPTEIAYSSGFILTSDQVSTHLLSGAITLTEANASNDTWTSGGLLIEATTNKTMVSSGVVSLVSSLEAITVISNIVTDRGTAGSVRVRWYY